MSDDQQQGEQKPGEQSLLEGGEQKPGEQKPGEQKPGEQKPADQQAPEAYEFKFADGVEIGDELKGKLQEFAKGIKLPKEQAAKLAELVGAPVQEMQKQYQEHVENVRKEWVDSARKDKEFGGEKLQENLAVAKKAAEAFGNEGFSQLIAQSGLGNHPEMLRFLWKVGQAIGNDKLVTGANRPAVQQGARTLTYEKSDHK